MNRIINHFVLLLFIATISFSCNTGSSDTEQTEVVSTDIEYSSTSDAAVEAFGKGLYEFYVGDADKASDLFDQAIAADENFALAYTYRAYCSNSAKEFVSYSNKAMDKMGNANEAEKYLIKINNTYLRNNLEERVQLAEQMEKQYPNSFIAKLELAGAYSGMNRIEDSRALLLAAAETNPDKIRPLLDLANSYMFQEQKSLERAEEYAREAVKRLPENVQAQIMLGDVYRAKNDLNKALTAYAKAADIDPENVVAVSKQGHANTFLGNYEAARANYEAANELEDTGKGQIIFHILTYVYDGNSQEALDRLMYEIAELDPEEERYVQDRGQLLGPAMQLAFTSENLGALESLMEMYRDNEMKIAEDIGTDEIKTSINAGLKLWDARIAMLKGDLATAKANVESYKTMMEPIANPNKSNGYHLNHGLIAMEEEDYPAAIEHLRKVDATNIYAQYNLAQALEMNLQTDEAMDIYNYLATYNFNSVNFAIMRNDCQEKANS